MALVIGGCRTVGPDYTDPGADVLQAWETDLYGQIGTAEEQSDLDLRFWWRVFNDPVLDNLVEQAWRENPGMQLAGLRILESRAVLGKAGATRYPQVRQATGSAAYVRTEQSGGVDTSIGSYGAGVLAAWEIDFWGKYKRGIESADAAFMASIANQQNLQVLLSAQVAELYFAYRTTLLRIAIAEANAKIQKRSFEITEKLYKSGQQAELDLQQAKTQYMSTLSKIPGLELILTQLRNALCLVLGRAPGNLPELDDEPQLLPVLEEVAIHDIPMELLLRRPDVRSAAWAVAAQYPQIGIAKADLYPSISLVGSLDWSGNTGSSAQDSITLGIGPTLTWNIFDGGLIRNNIRVQDARLQQAIVGFQNSLLSAATEIDDAAIGVVKTLEQKEPQRESTRAASRSLELANSRYREGYADFQRVIDAQRAVAAQAEKEVLNDSSHISAIISLYKALGGGWLDMPLEDMVNQSTREEMESRTNWGELLETPLPDGTIRPTEKASENE